mgnify:CR=1 FL=1
MIQHIVNISGGKDSAACAALARRRGRPFRLAMADTGHESEITTNYAGELGAILGVEVEVARADFSERIAKRRGFIVANWPDELARRALDVLVPTGNPFLDLCLWKGRFPSRKAQFCTEFLKREAIDQQILYPALDVGPVVQWIGVRRDESLNRRNAPFTQRVRFDGRHDMLFFRPIIHWTAADVFAFLKAEGIPPNPLYLQGMSRVGCFPCINASKDELAAIGRRFPGVVDRLMEMEELVKRASKHGSATFFASDVTPEGAALGKRLKARGGVDAAESAAAPWPRADEVFAWAKTIRGGKQFGFDNWIADQDEGVSCSSQYGLCE